MPLTVTMFLEAAGRVIDGGMVSLGDTVGVSHDVSLGDTTGVSRDVCLGDTVGVSRDVHVAEGAFCLVLSRDESTKYDMLVTSAIYINKETVEFLHSTVSNLHDCSKRFTFYFLADLFNRTPSELLWVASSDTAINSYTTILHCL